MNSRKKKRSLEVNIHPWQGLCINNLLCCWNERRKKRKKAIVIVRLFKKHGSLILSVLLFLWRNGRAGEQVIKIANRKNSKGIMCVHPFSKKKVEGR